jgi:hypothetical protein
MAANNASSLKGLSSKSTAPPAQACLRSLSLACAVTKTIGIRLSASARYRWSCKPSIPGIRMSRIRQFVSSTRLELRNSWADEKAAALKPKAPTRYRVESAIEASSSTMQTRGIVVGLAFGGTLRGWYASQHFILTPKGGPVLLDLGRNCGRERKAR